jgi:IS1 family transposase
VLTALAEGVGITAAARIFGHSEFTLQTWLTRAGLHAQSLHQRLLRGLHLGHVQLDEVRTAVRQGAQIVWVWIALDARSKLVAAMHIGPRTQDFAHALVHGAIQTALVERFNGTLRHGVSTLVRRTCGKAQLVGEMMLHLEWFRAYVHFVRPHRSLRQTVQTSLPLRDVQHYRQRTPAMVAGIASRRWSVLEVLSFPVPPGPRPDCVSCL